jgi:hypothetical protein
MFGYCSGGEFDLDAACEWVWEQLMEDWPNVGNPQPSSNTNVQSNHIIPASAEAGKRKLTGVY